MTLDDFIARARRGQATPVTYLLGKGGWHKSQAPRPAPGEEVDLAAELQLMKAERPQVHAQYMKAMQEDGLELKDMPSLACDCSGLVCWALNVARDGSELPGGWIYTDSIVADAKGARRLFVPVARAVPGALLVHPRPGGDGGPPGHVGIVTAVDAAGRATRVLHCAPDNIRIKPADGASRTAIAETDTAHFDRVPTSMVVMWKAWA